MFKKIFSKLNILRFILGIASIALILWMLPHPDHTSLSYELNQPWKYPLLTAEFDVPIYRDSTSMKIMRDSIDKSFVPFVKRDSRVEKENLQNFKNRIAGSVMTSDAETLYKALQYIYTQGVLDNSLAQYLKDSNSRHLRLVKEGSGNSLEIGSVDAGNMFTQKTAFAHADSSFNAQKGIFTPALNQASIKILNECIVPNIVLDTIVDTKYRDQEYLTVNAALGVIKTGQRIVDRGEIITPQIYTNLNTYMELMASRQSDSSQRTYFIIGQGVYITIIIITLFIFLSIYRPLFFSDIRKMTFLVSFITLFTLFAIWMFENVAMGLMAVPFAAVPVIVLVFFDSRTAIFSLISTVFLSALVATYPLEFLFMEFTVGIVATFSIWQLDRRSQLLRTAVLAFLTYIVTYLVMCLIIQGNFSQLSWRILVMFLINSVILSFAYVLILVIEKIFGFTSAVTLVELSDINSPLLRRLAEEAPGTFQHSMQVSTIASEAARAIGANTTLVRTGALYHDIGKLTNPIFFTENQHGVNPHVGLEPTTSAKKIISHVTDGISIANKHKLPALVKSFIMEHHGKGMAKYFYTTAVNNNPDKIIDKQDFSYPGPNPQTVETSILMMADAVEAASRSLSDYSSEAISKLVENIINGQIADGLFKESPISFHDIEVIKNVFKQRLATIYHTRVRYPELNKNSATVQNASEK